MQRLKGFIEFPSKIDNQPGVIAPIGELSTYSLTFAQDVGRYTHPDYQDVSLAVFSCSELVETPAATNQRVLLPVAAEGSKVTLEGSEAIVTQALAMGQWLFTLAETDSIVADINVFKDIFTKDYPDLINVTMGELVLMGDDNYPTFLHFTDEANGFQFELWFSDAVFRKDYDLYEIRVLPPTEQNDDLLLPAESFLPKLAAISYDQQINRIQLLKEDHPVTMTRALSYDWFDQTDSTKTTKVSWTLLVYGPAGDHLERLQTAIIDAVLGQTGGTEEQWQTAVPDLFSPTEYYIVPAWHQSAIPAISFTNSILSPLLGLTEMQAMADLFLAELPSEHRQAHLEATASLYKSLAFVVLGSDHNRNQIYRLSEMFPDYIVVSTISPDFARMHPDTQRWYLLLSQLLIAADTYNPNDALPFEMVAVERNGIRSIMTSFQGSRYLVTERVSYLEHWSGGTR